jgi:hypothetical protein
MRYQSIGNKRSHKKGRSTLRVTSFESEDQDLRDPKIHRMFPLGLTWAIFGPQILQKSCLPSERTGLGNFSSLLAVSYSDFEPFLKRTAPLGLCQPLWDVPSRCHATNLADSQCFKILLRISKSIPLDGRPPCQSNNQGSSMIKHSTGRFINANRMALSRLLTQFFLRTRRFIAELQHC